MGIFDIFTNDVAQQAANQQIAGLNAGNAAATGNINSAIGALTSGAGNASSALTSNFGNAGTALTNNYTAALQPFLQNYGTAQSGVTQLGNVLGLNGPAGSQAALTALQNTPGYQFQLQQGDNAINAQAAATGQNASGNQALALANYNQGLAGTTYNNYVNQLMPFLGASNSAASGIGNIYTGLGTGLANTATGLGSGLANVSLGLGQGVANEQNSLAGLNWQTQTGIGNANANATLAQNQANQNQFNAVMGLGQAALGIFSDERLKENIEPVGELYDGTSVYRYNYIGDDVPRIGVMAQEVEQSRPDAVIDVGGFKAVDYGKATDLAASLARLANDEQKNGSRGYAADLSRFLEAA